MGAGRSRRPQFVFQQGVQHHIISGGGCGGGYGGWGAPAPAFGGFGGFGGLGGFGGFPALGWPGLF